MLLNAAKELIGIKLLFTGSSAAENADVEHDHVATARLDAIEDVGEVIEIELIADRNEDVAGAGADSFGSEFAFDFKIELIHLDVSDTSMARALFGHGEDDVEKDGEHAAGHRCDGLREEVDDGDQEQGERDQTETERNLHAANREIERNLKIARAGLCVTENKNGEAVHGKGPDDAESV